MCLALSILVGLRCSNRWEGYKEEKGCLKGLAFRACRVEVQDFRE